MKKKYLSIKSFFNFKNDKSNGLMLKLVVSYSCFLFVILLLFNYLYYSTLSGSKATYNLQAQSAMASRVEQFESYLEIMDTNCRQLLQNTEFRRIMNYTPVDTSLSSFTSFLNNGHKVSDTIAVNIYADSLLPIKEVYYYLPNSGYLLSDSYFITEDHFYKWIKDYPNVLKDSWFELLKDPASSGHFLSLNIFQKKSDENYYLYIVNMDNLCFLDCNVRANFIVSRSELYKTLGINLNEPSFLEVYSNDTGDSILSINNISDILSDNVSSLKFTDGFTDYTYEDNRLTIGRFDSAASGLTYYYSFKAFDNNASAGLSTFLFISVLFGIIIAGAIIIYVISSRNVKPVIEINEELSESIRERSELISLVNNQKPIITRSYVRQLMLQGIGSEAEFEYIGNYFGFSENTSFKVMHVVVYDSSDNSDTLVNPTEGLSSDVKELIIESLKNTLGEPLYYFVSGTHSFSVLLTFSKDERSDYLISVQSAIVNLHNKLLSDTGLWLFAGIGKTTGTLMNVWESYEQAVEAVSYTSKNYIFLPYEYIKKDSNSYYYPQEFSNKLIHFITSGNKSSALEILRLIKKENVEERTLSAKLMDFLLTDIRNSLLKARFELPSSCTESEINAIDNEFNAKLSFALCNELAAKLCDLFSAKTDETSIIDTILQYIKDNYADSMLCLSKISDEFKISETYFSHLFKQKTGVNFSNYLENLRMQKAMELLKNGQPLNDIYERVGYNNSNSFRRAFKKVYGTTPGSVQSNG